MPSTPLHSRPSVAPTRADRIAAHEYTLPVVRPLPRHAADVASTTW